MIIEPQYLSRIGIQRGKMKKKDDAQKKKEGITQIPRKIRELSDNLYVTQISKKHYRGVKELIPFGSVAMWESLGIEYLIKITDLENMKYKKPQVYTDAKKNLYLLIYTILKQQKDKEEKKARAEFTLGEYLKTRGYTEEEIKRGGKFYELARQVIESGAYTSFRRTLVSPDGKRGIEILGSFYSIIKEGRRKKDTGEIKGKNTRYIISFNSPYSDIIEKWLKEGGQYYPVPLKMIADRNLDRNPVLFNFIDYLIYISGNESYPKNILHLLEDIGVKEDILKRPAKSFEILKKCLLYTKENYPEFLGSITILNQNLTKRLPLKDFKGLSNYTMKRFKEILKSALGEDDLRRCYVIFHKEEEPTLMLEMPGDKLKDNKELLEEILKWIGDWERVTGYEIRLDSSARKRYINKCIEVLGYDKVLELFLRDANASYPNAFDFLFKTLKEELDGKILTLDTQI